MAIEGGRIGWINAEAERLIGASAEAVEGTEVEAVLRPCDPGDGGSRWGELQFGTGRRVSVRYSATGATGGGEWLALWKGDEGAGAAALPSMSAAQMAHTFNNQLTRIQGYASLAISDLERGVAQPDYLRGISEAAGESELTARSLLNSAGSVVPDASPVELSALIDSVTGELLAGAGEMGVAIELAEDLPEVSAPAALVRDGLLSLLRNASEAGVREATLSTGRGEAWGAEVRIEFAEAGADDGGRAFRPNDSWTGGMGLGIPAVRAAMESFGGGLEFIAAERACRVVMQFRTFGRGGTAAGQGRETTAADAADQPIITMDQTTITAGPLAPLPVAPNPPAAPAPAPAPPPAAAEPAPAPAAAGAPAKAAPGKETILIVEDEDMVRDLVKRSLSYLGYQVVAASNGEEGLAVCRERFAELDMVFSDIVMPRMSGPEMVAKMQEEQLHLPVLYTTGFTDNKRLLDNGEIREGVNLLPKPYTTKVLATRIREVLDGVKV